MKTKQPRQYIHNRKLVMSYKERVTFDRDKLYYINLGYPDAVARQYASDHYYTNKRASNGR